jgi:hypothetical protein
MTIRCILGASITRHCDTRRTTARVTWLDGRRQQHETVAAYPDSTHVQALLLRAMREGVTVTREEF